MSVNRQNTYDHYFITPYQLKTNSETLIEIDKQ